MHETSMKLSEYHNLKEKLLPIILAIRKRLALFLVLLIYLFSALIWSKVELNKLYSFHAFVYDLGVQTSSLNSIARTYSLSKLLVLVPASKPFTLFISYITLVSPFPSTFLYIQSFGTLLASVFIYLIAKRKYDSEPVSIALSFSFIFFFPISWYLFFDFHIAGFFPTLFFAAIYLMDTRPKLSWILFFFASTTNVVLAFFLLFFMIIREVDHLTKALVQKQSFDILKITKNAVLLVVPIPTIAFAVWQYKLSGLSSFGGNVSNKSQGIISLYINNLISLFNSGFIILLLITILLLIIIVQVVNINEIIYIIAVLPIIAFILFGGYPFGIMKAQYDGEYFTPLLYFLILLPPFSKSIKAHRNEISRVNVKKKAIQKRGILLFVILIIFMGLFYNPYGPLNNPNLPGIDAYANFSHEINVTSSDKIANQFVGLVPTTSSVLIQDNEPQYAKV